MQIPRRETAEALLAEAGQMNPGPWIQHSENVAKAAQSIAAHHPEADAETAYILGLLHDIGRRVGVTDMRHILDGYTFLHEQGYFDAARVCLTHSYPIKPVDSTAGKWDGTPEEREFIREFIAACEFDVYDRLIQLCDALALPSGFCLIEKRLVDVALRHGFNKYTLERWRAFLEIQQQFDAAIGRSIYSVLPGVVENTFGFSVDSVG